jgi:hypothetical protein
MVPMAAAAQLARLPLRMPRQSAPPRSYTQARLVPSSSRTELPHPASSHSGDDDEEEDDKKDEEDEGDEEKEEEDDEEAGTSCRRFIELAAGWRAQHKTENDESEAAALSSRRMDWPRYAYT